MSNTIDEPSEDVVAENKRAQAEKRGLFGRIGLFLSQVIDELKKVVTPTREELIRFTLVVLAFVVIVMAIIFGLDQLYGWIVTYLFGNGFDTLQ